MQLVVLAGGLGTRLGATLPDGLPKALAPVDGRPFLDLVLERWVPRGVDEVMVLAGHHADALVEHYGSRWGSVQVRYSVEQQPLGTGGAVRAAEHLLADTFLLVNGDSFVDVDVEALRGTLDDGPLGMVLAQVDDTARFGAVTTSGGRATDLAEKGRSGPGLINAGVYAMRRELLALMPDGPAFSLEHDVLAVQVPRLRPRYVRASSPLLDIGVPADHARAAAFFRGLRSGDVG